MLPLELLRPIIEEINDNHTISYITSTAFQHDGERRLYHTPIPANSSPLHLDSTHVAFLSTVTTNPRLASLVHTYYLNDVVSYGEDPLWLLAKLGLRAMVNLKVFHFRAFAGHPAAEILDGCPFQLEHLHWGSYSDEAAMTRILPQQPKLRHLYLKCYSYTMEPPLAGLSVLDDASYPTDLLTFLNPDDCCPDLHSLAGNRMTIELFLPRRNIRKLSWVPGIFDSNEAPVPNSVTRALGRIETLSLGGYFVRPSLGTLVDHLRELRVLEIVGLSHSQHQEQKMEMIKRLPNLRELVISFHKGTMDIPFPNIVDRRQCIQRLFSQCPYLHLIDCVSSWLVINEIGYQRWTRGDPSPTLLLSTDVREGRF
jgi:hypothetical protein